MGVIGYLYNNIPLSNKKKNISIFKKGFGERLIFTSNFEKKYLILNFEIKKFQSY